jgi:hypothetical protein
MEELASKILSHSQNHNISEALIVEEKFLNKTSFNAVVRIKTTKITIKKYLKLSRF